MMAATRSASAFHPAKCGLIAPVVLLLFTAQASAAPSDLDRVMEQLARRQHGHVGFVERRFLAVLDRPVQSSGVLFYDAPDRLEMRTLKPRPESLALERGILTIEIGRHRRSAALQDYPQFLPLIEGIRATLAGDRHALEQIFRIVFDGSLERWTLLLTPSDAKLASIVKQIRIEGEQDDIHRIEASQADGDRSVMIIGAVAPP
jgi:hypothetical protein